MTPIDARFVGIALLSGALVACGGSATRDATDKPEGGAGAGGSSGTAASPMGGAGSAPQWLSDTKLDEVFPWFVEAQGGFQLAPEDGEPSLVHVRLEGTPIAAMISTHNHFAVIGVATAVSFSARASEPLTMLVTVRATVDGGDYFFDRDAGRPWPVAPVKLRTDLQRFVVPFADMMPADTIPTSMPAFMIGFIVERPAGPLELWLDDVQFL